MEITPFPLYSCSFAAPSLQLSVYHGNFPQEDCGLWKVDLIPPVDELAMPVIAVLAGLFQQADAFVPAAVAGAKRYFYADRRGVDRGTRLDDKQSRAIVTCHDQFALMFADHIGIVKDVLFTGHEGAGSNCRDCAGLK